MKNYTPIVFLFLLFYSLNQSTPAHAQLPVSIHFTIEQGLPSNTVYYVLQDHKGYIWLATDKGVVRYDGSNFTTFTTSNGLSDNECFDIFEDSQHRIWFATYNGEPCFYQNGIFYTKKNCPFLRNQIFKGPALKVLEDKNHTLFYMTFFGVFKLDSQNKMSRIECEGEFFSAMSKNSSGEVFLVGTNKKKENRIFNLTNTSTAPYSNSFKNIQINSKSYESNGILYYSLTNCLYVNDLKNKRFRKLKLLSSEDGHVIQYITKKNHEFWLGTNNGILITDLKNKRRTIFAGNSISSIVDDRENNTWISTINNGAYLLLNPAIYFYDKDSELKNNKCQSVQRLSNGKIGVGFEDFKFATIAKNEVRVVNLKSYIGIGFVKRIVYFEDYYYVATGSSMNKVSKDYRLVKDNYVSTKDFMMQNRNEIYTVGGFGICKFTMDNLFINQNDKRFKNSILVGIIKANGLFEDSKKNVYVYGLFGVQKFKNGTFTNLHSNPILAKNIMDIQEDQHGILWFASSVHGLIALYQNKVYQFGIKDGLVTDYISSLSLGRNNELWLGTTDGLSKVIYTFHQGKIKLNIRNYSQCDGLIHNTINDVLYDRDTIWLATPKGLCFFNQDHINIQRIKPLLNIEHLLVGGKEQSLLKKIILQPDQNNIKVSFKGLSYASLGKINYEYRLMGSNSKWNFTSYTKIEYPSLQAGNYTLEIRAVDVFGNQSSVSKINFKILPYFYQTWWFLLITIALLGVFLFVFITYRIKKIKLNHSLKEQIFRLEHERLKSEHNETILLKEYYELEQKALLLQMNPHFIFNSINSIQGLYKRNREQADEYLIKFSNLLRQILEFSRKKVIGLDQEIEFLKNYTEINKLRMKNDFQVHIHIDPELNTQSIAIAPMIIQPFIENALIHGIQSLKKDGEITLNFYPKKGQLICEIIDNGVGRERSKQINKTRIHQSVGMEITEKRLNFFNKNANHNSMEIIDLLDENNQALGTKVILEMNMEEFY